MNPFVEKIIPIILAFFIGIAFKFMKLLSQEDAPVLLKVVLNVCLPCLTINSISNIKLQPNMALIPLTAIICCAAECILSPQY